MFGTFQIGAFQSEIDKIMLKPSGRPKNIKQQSECFQFINNEELVVVTLLLTLIALKILCFVFG